MLPVIALIPLPPLATLLALAVLLAIFTLPPLPPLLTLPPLSALPPYLLYFANSFVAMTTQSTHFSFNLLFPVDNIMINS